MTVEIYDPVEVAAERVPRSTRPVIWKHGIPHYLCNDCMREGDFDYKPECNFRRIRNSKSRCQLMPICLECERERKRAAREKKALEVA